MMQLHSGEAYHGGINSEELKRYGVDASKAIDFSSNILAHGPSQKVVAAVREANLAAYPDRDCNELSQAIAQRMSLDPANILVGNGSCELIHLIARVSIQPQDKVLIVGPTFSEYQRASNLASADVIECLATAADRFSVPLDQVDWQLNNAHFKLVWLCNPNNPTGCSVCSDKILNWVQTYPDTMFVIDESYIEFADQATSVINFRSDNLVVLRSMTKSFGIAGLRLGYAVVSSELRMQLCRHRVPWSVSAPAQVAGIAALQDEEYYSRAIAETRAAKEELFSDLILHGFAPIPSDANYFLLPLKNASLVRLSLLSQGIIVRDCTSFGLPNHLRIAVLDPKINRKLVQSLLLASDPQHTHREKKVVEAESSDRKPLANRSTEPSISQSWDSQFRERLRDLFRLRRDVRRFKPDAVAPESLKRWVEAACLAPSVGLSQPWKLVTINNPARRASMVSEFETQNHLASQRYGNELATKYLDLKLSGMKEAPEHLAVFVDPEPAQGHGLGRQTMPESVAYSVVAAIQNFWLAARSEGVGVGWISIVRPQAVNKILELPEQWRLIAYLCIGYPQNGDVDKPELETVGWESRIQLEEQWHQR